MMEKLFEKYYKAKEGYKQYSSINSSNKTEGDFLDLATATLKLFYPNVIPIGDCWLNFIGADFICGDNDGHYTTIDLKTCQHNFGYWVLIDAYKKSLENEDELEFALNQKATEHFLFINEDNVILVPRKTIIQAFNEQNPGIFTMGQDWTHTTKKANLDLSFPHLEKNWVIKRKDL